MHPEDPYTQRKGFNDTQICTNETLGVRACTVRQHFIEWSKRHPKLMNVDRCVRKGAEIKLATEVVAKHYVSLVARLWTMFGIERTFCHALG